MGLSEVHCCSLHYLTNYVNTLNTSHLCFHSFSLYKGSIEVCICLDPTLMELYCFLCLQLAENF